ncbi:saccharopine dehydrogenase family protein [Paenibacillus sp. NPDC057934]|uniref:saccharopine dehydrogenase family protein n=1 Tax=Paenibacillus sp. NPDC057934 TaxID=3346282 RepID=UPI0036D977B8
MNKDIIVIGGYGHVGSQICTLLSEHYPGHVYAAGRSLERAEQFCKATGSKVKPLRLDLTEKADPRLLKRAKLVVMCMDQQDTAFAEACLQNGVYYVDVSANGAFLARLEALASSSRPFAGTAVLSVGLAPGLTNMLARHASEAMDHTDCADITIMLGLGDRHGKAAIEWTIDNLRADFDIMEKGSLVAATSFTSGKISDLGEGLGRRTAYRFPFSDQQTLPRTLGIASVSTRLCFDSRIATGSVALMQKFGLKKMLHSQRMRKAAVWSFSKLRYGSDQYAIKVDACGTKNGLPYVAEYGIQGRNEARITARTAAAVAGAIYSATLPPGIFHIEELFTLELASDHLSLRLADTTKSDQSFTIDEIRCWTRELFQQHK